jgi:UPF0176 protein
VLGRIYVANEGINAQISVPDENFKKFKKSLEKLNPLNGIRLNLAVEQYNKSFLKLTIKVRDKIVADGLDDKSFDVTKIGDHLNAKEFNQMLNSTDTVCVDMRNHYESEIGYFKGAVKPDVDTFRESLKVIDAQLEKNGKEKNYLMYCTGGIRCEKASAYLKHKGVENVYQLEGGIIEYTRQVKQNKLENNFIGKNFVFDERKSERISEEVVASCHQCGEPADTHVNCSNVACHLLFIQCKKCQERMNTCCSEDCKTTIELSYDQQKELRKGKQNSNKIFKKGRASHIKFNQHN